MLLEPVFEVAQEGVTIELAALQLADSLVEQAKVAGMLLAVNKELNIRGFRQAFLGREMLGQESDQFTHVGRWQGVGLESQLLEAVDTAEDAIMLGIELGAPFTILRRLLRFAGKPVVVERAESSYVVVKEMVQV